MERTFPIPEFLQETEEDIHQRMIKDFPPDISTSEGSIVWDATRPTAIEKAEMITMQLINAMKTAFPQYSYGEYLEFLGVLRSVWKKEATKSTGMVRIEGTAGTSIPAGTIVIVPSDGIQEVIEFQTTQRGDIDHSEYIEIPIEALKPGVGSNVDAGTIQALGTNIKGVRSVINQEAVTGGTEREDDEDFRERLIAAYKEMPLSGAKRDYERWAKEVDGVGEVSVIPEWNGPGTVKVVVIDANGAPASQVLIEAVQMYIAPDGRSGEGLAPIGALVTVSTRTQFIVDVSFKWTVKDGVDEAKLISDLRNEINQYFRSIKIGGTIVINYIGALIIQLKGVIDYSEIALNGVEENIVLQGDDMAIVGTVTPHE